VDLNRAVAVGNAHGAERGLEIVDTLDLPNYPLVAAVRGDLLAKLGRNTEARHEFERAAAMTRNARERSLFEARVAALESPRAVAPTTGNHVTDRDTDGEEDRTDDCVG
jgi:predicted RNA polymerase sigma factor